jgi:transcriptional regulator with XRE-family HTH domain
MADVKEQEAQPGALWALIEQWLDAMSYPPSQARLAERLKISDSTMSEWKYGRSFPSAERVKRLADELGVHPDRVIDAVLIDRGYRPAPPKRRDAV